MPHTTRALASGRLNARAAGRTPNVLSRSTKATADMWRSQIEQILGRPYRPAGSGSSSRCTRLDRRAGPLADAAPSRGAAYDVDRATLLGQFVEAAYAMFYADPNDLTPPPSSNFPSGYRLMASISMRDFVLGSTKPLFYGFVAQSLRDPS